MADDSVANLKAFNSLLSKTSDKLGDQNSTLDSEEGDLEKLSGDAEDKIGDFNDVLEDALQELEQASDDAEAAVEQVTDTAADITQARLSKAEDELEEAQGDFDEAREEGQGQFEESFTRLTESGFQALGNTVDEVEGELQRIGGASQDDFDGLDGALEESKGRVDEARSETSGAIEEAKGDIDADGDAVEDEFKDVTQRWNASVDEALKDGCEEVGSALAQEYADWGDAATAVADALAQAVSDAVMEAAEFLGQTQYQTQENALTETMNGPGDALLSETGEGAATLEMGQAVTNVLEPMIGELEIVLHVVDQIDQLLKAME